MRMLAYGVAADMIDDYVRIGATTARLCLSGFVDGIISLFRDEYLRHPNNADMQRLLHVGEQRGWPGMIGSIDCMHWTWKNCPTAWKGQYARGGKPPIVVLEAVASYDLWIWHAFFGTPGMCNDINVLDRSLVFDEVLHGRAPKANFVVNGHEYAMTYYLADGIYPPWRAFIPSIRHPFGAKDTLFSQVQELTRKDVERAFGVLQQRFAIICQPSLVWDLNFLEKIITACIILHNMIVKDERDSHQLHVHTADFDQLKEPEPPASRIPTDMTTFLSNRAEVRDSASHHRLKSDFIEHIWQKFGAS